MWGKCSKCNEKSRMRRKIFYEKILKTIEDALRYNR